MNFYEYLKDSKKTISHSDAIELLMPIFIKCYNWHIGDDYCLIRQTVKSRIANLLKNIYELKEVKLIFESNTDSNNNDEPVFSFLDILNAIYRKLKVDDKEVVSELANYFNVILDSKYIENKPCKLRDNQIAKIKCQALAQYLWHQTPDFTIEQLKDHHAIKEIGDSKNYIGKDTIRGWLREVDPRQNDKKTGPKKKMP